MTGSRPRTATATPSTRRCTPSVGYESVWPVEQHFFPASSILSSPLVFLAAVAARTSTLRLGTGVILLPLAHPLRVAEDVATLDLLSGGRVDCGVGRGMDPFHFAGYGVDPSESAARLEEVCISYARR